MMRYISLLFLVLVFAAFSSSSSLAQGGLFGLGGNDDSAGFFDDAEEPATGLPALPQIEDDTEDQARDFGMQFPELPPSRLCRKRDILGMWRLETVFETPASVELEDFGQYPYQYVLFKRDNTFRIYKSAYDENTDTDILREMQTLNTNVLEQYVVHKVDGNTVVYLYKDGVAIYSVACFIVANPASPFSKGQMLFMPPPERAETRMVKAYTKLFSAAKKKKKKRRRRRK